MIGGQAGYNFQVNSFVFGVQGDFASAVTQGDSVCNAPLPSPPFQGPGAMTRCWTETEWLASATARAGVTWDRALIYIKGGAAWLSSVYELGRGEWFAYSVEPHFRKRETRAGWTIGAGIEYALSPRVSGFIEYNYYDFGTRTIDLPMVQFPDIIQPMAIRQDMQVVKVGLNSRFGGGEQAKPTIPVKAAARDSLRLHNWTGFYAGGHVGHGWSEREALPNFTNVRDNFSSQTFSSGVTSGGVDYLLQTDYLENFQGLRGRHHGWFGGVQGGYSYQFNSGVVAGVVGDFSFRGVEASSSGGWVQSTTDFYNYYTDATYTTLVGSELINNSLGGSLNLNARLDYFGTLRGRLGFAWGQFLPYVTGGLAWGENSVTAFGRNSTTSRPRSPSTAMAPRQGGLSSPTIQAE